MSFSDLHSLARTISERRTAAGLTRDELGRRSGVAASTITRIETARYAPRVETLTAIARTFGIPVSDLFITADWIPKDDLPSFTPYFRSKYRDMPAAAQREIEASVAAIAEKYGYDPRGPQPGEDET